VCRGVSYPAELISRQCIISNQTRRSRISFAQFVFGRSMHALSPPDPFTPFTPNQFFRFESLRQGTGSHLVRRHRLAGFRMGRSLIVRHDETFNQPAAPKSSCEFPYGSLLVRSKRIHHWLWSLQASVHKWFFWLSEYFI